MPLTYDQLVGWADGLPTTAATPAGIAKLLSMSRQAFALSFYSYDQLHSAAMAAFTAMEAAVRQLTDTNEKLPYAVAIKRGAAAGVLTSAQAELATDFTKLRNPAAHAAQPFVLGPAGTTTVLSQAHKLLYELYPDRPVEQGTQQTRTSP